MKSALLIASGLLATSVTTASAGGYLGLALGTQPAVNDEFFPAAGRSARVLGGSRFGNVSIEGAFNGFGVVVNAVEQNVYQLSGALKLNLPLGNNFEGFGRAGVERTWLNLDDGDGTSMAGNGFLIGGGFEYRLNIGVSSASIFVDYNVHRATLDDGHFHKMDLTSRIWGLGLLVGL